MMNLKKVDVSVVAHPLFFIYGKLVTNMPSIASKEMICEFVRAIRGFDNHIAHSCWIVLIHLIFLKSK